MAEIPVNANDAVTFVDVTYENQVNFDYDFRADVITDLKAEFNRIDDTIIQLVGGTDFTASGLGTANGGTITLTTITNAVVGERVTIFRDTIVSRASDYSRDLFAEDLNAEQDTIYMILQELVRDVARSFRAPFGIDPTTPSPEVDKVLGWNSSKQLVNIDPAEFIDMAGLATAAQGAKADTAAQRSQLPMNCTDFGILPGLASSAATISAFLSAANSAFRSPYFPAGDYNISSQIVFNDARVAPYGDGSDLTRFIFTGATKGLKYDNVGLLSDQRTIEPHGMAFLTNGAGVGTAVEFVGSPIEGGGLRRSISVNKCRFAGVDPSKGWEYDLKISGALTFSVTESFFAGAATIYDSAPAQQTKASILFGAGSNIGEVSNNVFDWVYTALKSFDGGTFSEGVNFHHNTIRACVVGVDIDDAGQYFVIADNHFDVVLRAVKLGADGIIGQDFSGVRNNFILRSSAASWGTAMDPLEFCAIDVNANYVPISGNVIWLEGTVVGGVARYKNSVGIRCGSATDANKQGRSVISGNIIAGCSKSVELLATTRRCLVTGNYADDFGNPDAVGYVNGGDKTNIIRDNSFILEAGTIVKENVGADKRMVFADVYLTATLADITGDNTAVGFGGAVTASKNIGAALNAGTMSFTAPVAGVYSFTGFLTFTNATTSHLGVLRWVFSAAGDRDLAFYPFCEGMQYSFEQYMNAGETVFPIVLVRGGAKVVDLLGGAKYSKFTMRLVRPD